MSDIDMPLLGYGTFPLKDQEARDCTLMALELGYRHLDTAQMYRNEADVGRAMAESGLAREKIFLTTKVHPDNYGQDDFAPSVRQSLDILRLDQVDLLLLHWPHPSLEMEAVLEKLIGALEAGQARSIGVSNFSPDDLARAQDITGNRIACNQIELHPFIDQSATIEAAATLGVSLVAYCPVARGEVLDDPTLQAIGKAHERTPAQIAIAWLVQMGIAAIPMSRNRERADANLQSATITLGDDEMRRISAIGSKGGKMISPPGLTPVWGRAT